MPSMDDEDPHLSWTRSRELTTRIDWLKDFLRLVSIFMTVSFHRHFRTSVDEMWTELIRKFLVLAFWNA